MNLTDKTLWLFARRNQVLYSVQPLALAYLIWVGLANRLQSFIRVHHDEATVLVFERIPQRPKVFGLKCFS